MKINKIILIILTLLIILVIGGYFFVFVPVKKIQAKMLPLQSSAKELKVAFSKNNIDLLNNKFDDFSKKYNDFKTEAKSAYWISYVPFLGAYVNDFKNGVDAGDYFIKAGKLSIEAIAPYADLIGFKKGAISFVERSAEDRLETAILTLDKVLAKIDAISDNIAKGQEKLEKIDPKRYPAKIGKIVVRDKITNIKEQINGATTLFVDAKPLLKKLPTIFGKDKEQIYLVLFQNDKELRATGGFLTSYALFKVNKGKIRIEGSDDIYSLDNSISAHPVAPPEILTYHKGVSNFYIRDSNLSPDLVESIKLFSSLYQKSSRRVNYDGVITIDSRVLVDMLTIFGDTEADGIRFSSTIDKRCNCPQVLYTLFDMVDRPTPYIRENRKGILGDLMYSLFYKAIGFSPSKYWGTLAQNMFTNLREKHILLNFVDPEVQQSVEKMNYAGRVRDFNGDYLYVNDVNFAGAKSNLFVSESITSKTKFNSDGSADREVTLEYKNPFPHSDCSLERGGLCLNATLRDWVRIYVPKGSKLIDFAGSQKKVNVYDDLNKTVIEGFLTVDPLGKATAIIKYKVPSKAIDTKNYSLMVQKQPGTDGNKLRVELDSKKLFDGILSEDKVIKN